jgi:DNA-binding XRE family transcriptional regulator
MASIKGNQKVAKNRGLAWNDKLGAGRLDAIVNPSILRIFRAKAKISQGNMAKQLDMAVSTYGSIERGKRLVKELLAKAIAETLKTEMKKIFKRSTKNKFVAIVK